MEENKLIKEQLEIAPLEIKKILVEGKWSATIKELAQKYSLAKDQLVSLENEVLFVLLGMELGRNLSENLKANTGLDDQKTIEISKEIYEKILKSVEQFLPTDVEREIIETKKEGPSPAVPEVPPANLPVLEPDFAKETIAVKVGETAHNIPHVEIPNPKPQITDSNQNPISKPQTPVSPLPNTKYPGGKDPYREPIA